MFSVARRDELRAELVDLARDDDLVTGAALVGSAARGETDRWSDVDLAVRLAPGADVVAVADAWTATLGARHEVASTLDLWSGPALYRVFLLADSLQVDLSFWPAGSFGSNGETFTLLFGTADADPTPEPPDRFALVGWAWLFALHARSAIARGRRWQAVVMLDGLRDRVISLACLRHGLPAFQGRGVDRLPAPLLAGLAETLPALTPADGLSTAFGRALELLLVEAAHLDPGLACRLRPPLAAMATLTDR